MYYPVFGLRACTCGNRHQPNRVLPCSHPSQVRVHINNGFTQVVACVHQTEGPAAQDVCNLRSKQAAAAKTGLIAAAATCTVQLFFNEVSQQPRLPQCRLDMLLQAVCCDARLGARQHHLRAEDGVQGLRHTAFACLFCAAAESSVRARAHTACSGRGRRSCCCRALWAAATHLLACCVERREHRH